MRLKVEVHGLDEVGNVVKRGEILFDGKKITASDNTKRLQMIMTLPLRVGDREILPKKEPEEFMRFLNWQYRSAYLQCSEARRS
jgi:hypothetical protein